MLEIEDHAFLEDPSAATARPSGRGWIAPAVAAVAWVLVLVCLLACLCALAGVTGFAAVAALQGVAPVLAPVFAPVALAGALTRRYRFAAVTVLLLAAQLVLVLPASGSDPVPSWAARAPSFRLFVANVRYSATKTFPTIRQIEASNADVLVLAELTWDFVGQMEREGMLDDYRYQQIAATAEGPRGIAVFSKLPMSARRFEKSNWLRIPIVTVRVGGRDVTVIGAHPPAPKLGLVGPWNDYYDTLSRLLRERGEVGEVIIAGDMNAARWHPPLRRLLQAGLHDVHEERGLGLSFSWPAGAGKWLGFVGPFVRLDHALVTDGIAATEVMNRKAAGSDHTAFIADLAVRQ